MADDQAPKKEKKKPEGLVIPPKQPKLTKAERRALQEQQRAAKAQGGGKGGGKGGGGGGKGGQQQGGKGEQQQQQKGEQQQQQGEGNKPKASKEVEKDTASVPTEKSKEDSKTIDLFSHLPPYQDPKSVVDTGPRLWPTALCPTPSPANSYPLHPAVIVLGYQYARGEIRGGNARCRAMLRVFHQAIGDFQPPSDATLTDQRQQIEQFVLKPSFQYWTSSCRPHSVTMGNAFTFLKTAVSSLERDMARDKMVAMIQDTIEAYIRERIDLAQQAIAQQPALSIGEGDKPQVFLTYGNSEAIAATFLRMAEVSDVSRFRVIVVDSRPLLEGKQLLIKLREANIECSYVLLSALTYVMRDVTKVYLGAAALMSDGGLLGRVGTACVALSAHMHHIPVLACCESYKISNRVQLESITGNELGDPSQVAALDATNTSGSLENWLEKDNLRLLNLLYDLTPCEFVSGIVTELGIIPPTSVAVLLREMNAQTQNQA